QDEDRERVLREGAGEARPLIRLAPDFLTLEEQAGPAPFPLRPLVEHDHRIDQRIVELVERTVDRAARGNAVARLDDRLSFPGQDEVGEEQRRMRVRRTARK